MGQLLKVKKSPQIVEVKVNNPNLKPSDLMDQLKNFKYQNRVPLDKLPIKWENKGNQKGGGVQFRCYFEAENVRKELEEYAEKNFALVEVKHKVTKMWASAIETLDDLPARAELKKIFDEHDVKLNKNVKLVKENKGVVEASDSDSDAEEEAAGDKSAFITFQCKEDVKEDLVDELDKFINGIGVASYTPSDELIEDFGKDTLETALRSMPSAQECIINGHIAYKLYSEEETKAKDKAKKLVK
jgi:hypothetical protein